MAEPGNGSRSKGGTKAKAKTTSTPRPEPSPEMGTPETGPEARPETGKERGPVCTVAFCPICMAVTAAQGAAPDAIDHLLAAAREFFLAARAVIDSRGDHLADPDGETEVGRKFERIDIS